MKKLTTVIVFVLAFSALRATSRYQHEKASEELVLNNGTKWKIDQATGNNVARLQQIGKKVTGNTLAGYHHAGTTLQAGIDQMIKECRMKGPDHLALHKWLEPLMEQVAQLNQATNAASAKNHFNEVKKRLHIFHQYFKV
jgi:putative N-acetylmannosamine-6-phosphate epimerase